MKPESGEGLPSASSTPAAPGRSSEAAGPSDAGQREQALDTARSFIVQAPAGSGKTGLLTQRYLALLATVAEPEQVLAITFTRKAAAEMRARILDALRDSANASAADLDGLEPYQRVTHQLAARVLAADRQHGWQILDTPGRLRVTTIDAYCLQLTAQLPWLSGFGGRVSPVDDAMTYYRRVSRELVATLDGHPWSSALRGVLAHLDNDVGRLQSLVEDLLSKRDQWLRYLGPLRHEPAASRATLEQGIERLISSRLAEHRRCVERALHATGQAQSLMALARYAAEEVAEADPDSPILAAASLNQLPGAEISTLPVWRALAALLLTRKGEWRKRFDRTIGFGPKRDGIKERKAEAQALIDSLRDFEDARLALVGLNGLPGAAYTEAEWRALADLLEVLPVAAALLQVEFRASGEVDFIEVVGAAGRALGTEGRPTDLALMLDYRIQHLLVDEFQDTSHSHEQLLAALLRGWQPGDGRTLFLVGDPMQSIYRFREADVGVFLRARTHGLGPVRLVPLHLEANFRSRPALVEWVNDAFPAVFAPADEPAQGAVAYRPARAVRGAVTPSGVTLHALEAREHADEAEAELVCRLAREAMQADPNGSIALLARSRGHLSAITDALHRAGIPVTEVGIERFADIPAVQDLCAIARALLHPADRVAWLSLLRAPWCALRLHELHQLVGGDLARPVWVLLREPGALERVSAARRGAVTRFIETMSLALEANGRASLRDRVEAVWLGLGGPAAQEENRLAEAAAFLDRLDVLAAQRHALDADDLVALLDERIDTDPAASTWTGAVPAPATDTSVQLMTVHRAKGLEFDTVIVPSLARQPRSNRRELLAWGEHLVDADDSVLLLAPLPGQAAPGQRGESALYQHLTELRRTQERNEVARLLYVAVTRAREHLHLIGAFGVDDEGSLRPPAASSLALPLWERFMAQAVRSDHDASAQSAQSAHEADGVSAEASARRGLVAFPPDWQAPAAEPGLSPTDAVDEASPSPEDETPAIEFDWAGIAARHVGTVVHRTLQSIASLGPRDWLKHNVVDGHERGVTVPGPGARITAARLARWRARLALLGVPEEQLDDALQRVNQAVLGALTDPRGQWVLSSEHEEGQSELALTGRSATGVRRVVIDRTFVDTEGTRWVIDYKTGDHQGGQLETFLDQEQARYAPQLEGYARLIQRRDSRPVQLGLYFPILKAWRSWPFDGGEPRD